MHKTGLRIGFVFAMALCAVPLRAQDVGGSASATGGMSSSNEFEVNANARVLLAMSSRDYLVTPGDVYTLSFAQGTRPVDPRAPQGTGDLRRTVKAKPAVASPEARVACL